MWRIGIDEAGYGPLLGPLVLGATVWELERAADDDLWRPLEACVASKLTKGEWRLVVGDSKQVYKRGQGIGTLERSVRAFAEVSGCRAANLHELVRGLGAAVTDGDGALPWYQKLDQALPLDAKQAASEAVIDKLRTAMQRCGVQCRRLLCEVVTEDRYNGRVAKTQNKAAVLLEHVLRLLERALAATNQDDVHVVVDRLGGRAHYREVLMSAYPQRQMRVLDESPQRSAYELSDASGVWRIEFVTSADDRHLPVALASMTAKYVREALMAGFNAYWRRLCPELKATAGYYADAQRFLKDIQPLVAETGLETGRFVRSR